MRKQYIAEKRYTVIEMWKSGWWKFFYKTEVSVKEHLRESFPNKHPLRQDQFLPKLQSGALFGYVQCDIKVPERLKEQIVSFPPIYRIANKCGQDNGSPMEEYAENEVLISQPRPIKFYSFELFNDTIITPLLLFYLEMGLECTKNLRFVQYTPVNFFDTFVQSAVMEMRITTTVYLPKRTSCLPAALTSIK